jgi:hypothetical protein
MNTDISYTGVDLYVCAREKLHIGLGKRILAIDTVIARFSRECSDYSSGLLFACFRVETLTRVVDGRRSTHIRVKPPMSQELGEALRRAQNMGFVRTH